jgi:UDP-GlcNAc3NAcA epimerase
VKVLTVVGARPQFVKMAPVSRALAEAGVKETVVHTGQHYDEGMSGIFFRELGIREPDHNLGVGSGPHGAQTAAMLKAIEELLLKNRPDVLLVYGDTNSTLAGGLAAVKLHVPVAHVEAGPRNRDMRMPEEVNRILVDHLSTWLFAPTRHGAENLAQEGIRTGVHVVGDVMVDSMHQSLERAQRDSRILQRLELQAGRYVLATIHRADNTDDRRRLEAILDGLGNCGMPVVFPIHPRTRKAMAAGGIKTSGDLRLIDPVGYLDMLMLEGSAKAIVTDSGGVQKEAYLSGVPCITVQETTGWPETVEAGWNRLVGANAHAIKDLVQNFRPDTQQLRDAFGPPGASKKIVDTLLKDVQP